MEHCVERSRSWNKMASGIIFRTVLAAALLMAAEGASGMPSREVTRQRPPPPPPPRSYSEDSSIASAKSVAHPPSPPQHKTKETNGFAASVDEEKEPKEEQLEMDTSKKETAVQPKQLEKKEIQWKPTEQDFAKSNGVPKSETPITNDKEDGTEEDSKSSTDEKAQADQILRPLPESRRPPPPRRERPQVSKQGTSRAGLTQPTSIHSLGSDLKPPQQNKPQNRPPPPMGPSLHSSHRQQHSPPPPPRQSISQQNQSISQQRPLAPPLQQQQQRPLGPPTAMQHEPPFQNENETRPPYHQQMRPGRPTQVVRTQHGPPPGQRPPPPHQAGQIQPYRRPTKQAPTQLRRLWGRIEKGLDSLADLEDAVSGRASQLFETAKDSVNTAKETVMGPSAPVHDADDIPIGSSIQQLWKPRRKPPPSKAPPAPLMDMSRFQKRVAPAVNRTATANSTSFPSRYTSRPEQQTEKPTSSAAKNPYGVVLEAPSIVMEEEEMQSAEQRIQKMEYQGLTRPKAAQQRAPAEPRTADCNLLSSKHSASASRMIRANGGASAPPPGPGAGQKLVPHNAAQQQIQPQQSSPPRKPESPRSPRPAMTNGKAREASRPPPKPRPSYDSDDESSWRSKITSALPRVPMPSLRNPFRRRSSRDMYTMSTLDAWKANDDSSDGKGSGGLLSRIFSRKEDGKATDSNQEAKPGPLSDLMNRCDNGKTASLLTQADKHSCRRIGRYQAATDLIAIAFLLGGLHLLPGLDHGLLPASALEVLTLTIPGIFTSILSGMDTFAPFAFAAAFLTIQTSKLMSEGKIDPLAQEIHSSISEDAKYGALFLRLLTATTTSSDISDKLHEAARAQITSRVDAARLTGLVTSLIVFMVLMTASIVKPILLASMVAIEQVISLDQLKSWPPQRNGLGKDILSIATLLWTKVSSVFASEFSDFFENPLRCAYGLSIAASLLGAAILARSGGFGAAHIPENCVTDGEDDEDDETRQLATITERVSNLGASSSSRLTLLSDSGGIDAVLERWRQMIPQDIMVGSGQSFQSFIHLVSKGIGSGFLLVLPLIVYKYAGLTPTGTPGGLFPRWDSLLDVSVLLLFTQGLSWKALCSSTTASDSKDGICGFLSSLASLAAERSRLQNAPAANLQLQAAVSPAAGLAVRDLWAAHTAKRAWAVRGATLGCKNGEVLVIMGDDAAGKSRLMTTLAESMCLPPQQARTTNKVRGVISVGGIDVTKWDSRLLRKRTGLVLNDVRTISDLSQILSGLSLEEILEPSGGIRNLELSHSTGANEKACMVLALKITGLYSSLLPKLPSKLSTIVTANEEDILRASALQPLYQILSPAEWSKLLLARVLAQTIHDNENVAGNNENVENCLMGSLLLLDDATLYLNEVEEARLLRELRKTGAATVLTSNRWAAGRFADRIAVVKDGAVVESGTHGELLNRGPQHSLYAAKWHALSTA